MSIPFGRRTTGGWFRVFCEIMKGGMGSYGTDIEDKLRFDLYYIRNYSFWLDLVILLRTLVVLIDNKKAEARRSTH